jgi:two-component system, NtrC family, nitrogen regulation sensor histidine kinase GlnL
LAWKLLLNLENQNRFFTKAPTGIRMYKNILDHLNTAILLFNSDLNLMYINTSGEVLLADSARHLIGIHAGDLFKSSDPAILANIQQCLGMGEPLTDRELMLDRMLQTFTVNLSATPLTIDDTVNEILVELQRVDNHLRISKEEQLLSQQNTARLLVRGLAHEIKNPLGGLRGAAQLLNLEVADPELKEYTQIIIAESDRLQGLMDKLLGPNKPPEFKTLNIHEVIERVRQLVEVEATGDLEIVCDYDPSIPDIHADRDLLIQAVLNIVKNAVQAVAGNGKIVLKSRIQRNVTIGRQHHKLAVKIDVIDNGPGINPDIMERIFYPMITSRAEGTGLGLSIAQSLINQHNGLIECESVPGNTVFSIILPI